jgi:serine protease AprX
MEGNLSRITINGITIDPIRDAPALAAANLSSADASGSNFILVQVKAPLAKTERSQLEALGVEILEYVPENTYICKYTPSDLGRIRALPFVAWANVYLRGFKVSPALRPASAANMFSLAPAAGAISKDRVTVEIVTQKNSMTDAVRDKIAAAAGVDPSQMQTGQDKVRATVEERRLDAIAAIDEVRSIEKYFSPQTYNDVARGILTADQAQAAGTMRGEGEIVCVCDTGFDKGDLADVHPAFTGRVVRLYPLGRNVASDPDGHGTHVCGSVLGDGVAEDGTVIRGTAPAARLVMQSVLDSQGGLGGIPVDLHDLFLPPYQNDGARVHTNSWGGNAQGAYTANSSEVDDFVWSHRDCVICFAAGNDGKDTQGVGVITSGSVGTPATAKNSIVVGASENNRPSFGVPQVNGPLQWGQGWPQDFPAAPINPDGVANNAEGMAAFSSRGPAINGRTRPDVVAPGSAILSTKSRFASGNGWAPYDSLFFYDGGTSMATPLAAGCAAVVRQYLISRGASSPSAALVKAMLINGAKPMHGQYTPSEVGGPPDNSQGFGRIDLAATVGPYSQGAVVVYKDEATTLDTGDTEQMQQAVNAGQTLKATVVWTDPAGEALQNDLDLIVRTPDGREFHGNVTPGAAGFDRSNNVEQVTVPNIAGGTATVIVQAYRAVTPQSYALVVRVS